MKLRYAVVFEQTPNNYGAYAPDVPGCISTGKTWVKIQEMIREALTFHIEDLLEQGEPLPEPKMSIDEAIAHHSRALEEWGTRYPPRVRRPCSFDLDDFPDGRG